MVRICSLANMSVIVKGTHVYDDSKIAIKVIKESAKIVVWKKLFGHKSLKSFILGKFWLKKGKDKSFFRKKSF